MKVSKYSIGLDIGSNSVGWAVVDENDQLVKKGKKTLWGVRMFEESQDASGRRSFRSNRRRLNRRHQRIMLLRDIFYKEIALVDPTFFERLDDSFYHVEDKKNKNYYNLFNGEYTDKDYYKEYPTIFHLRRHLVECDEKADIRFIYLALHHMIKYRGNFLTSGEVYNKGNISQLQIIFDEFNTLLDEYANQYPDDSDYFERISMDSDFFKNLEAIFLARYGKNERKKKLLELFKVEKKTLVNECLVPLLSGSKCDFSKLLIVKENKYEKCEITLDEENLEAVLEEKAPIVPEFADLFEFVPSIKQISDHYFLVKLLANSDSISASMVESYEIHKQDLERLKYFIKTYQKDKYHECFRKYDPKLNNYVHYVGMNSTNKVMKRFSHCKREDFYKYLMGIFKNIKDADAKKDIDYFSLKIENNEFLLRQDNDQNGSIPMQLHLAELRSILEHQKKYYPFLLEEDSDGLSNAFKIESIFKFKLPYYVGPLNNKSEYAWIKRTEEKIYPWNYEEVIDLDETAKEFIERMQNKCTYLKGKDDYCLPSNSLIFSEYNTLSYLNKLSINGALISKEMKDALIQNVFLKKKKPTKKDIVNYLFSNYGDMNFTNSKNDIPEVTCDMASEIKFREIFKDKFEEKKEDIERIIKDICIFEDKSILAKRLKDIYQLSPQEIKMIKDLNYKKYGRLSKKLLTEILISDPMTGEIYGSVLDIMRNTNYNLQQILFDPKYRLQDIVDEYNKQFIKSASEEYKFYDFLKDNITISPVMVRPLCQTMAIIEEIEKILGFPASKYYVECTRSNQEQKKPTSSRYKNLQELFKDASKLAVEFGIDMKKLSKELDDHQNDLRSDAIYLYFTQLGRCMYSLEPIDLGKLIHGNNEYDVDHIYPQALVKDDSLANRVLAKKELNNAKSDKFLFECSYRTKEHFKFYELLHDKKLITKEKYKRLIQNELKDNELDGFVNRQIVVTNQATKALITSLKLYKHVDASNIIYSKAENISDFRHKFDILKSRTANNFHHAHDAYLNAVIGRALNDYYIGHHFNSHLDYVRLRNEDCTINAAHILNYNRFINGKCIWNKDYEIALLNKNIKTRFDVMETFRTYNPSDMFAKTTVLPAGNDSAIPVKLNTPASDVSKYGGITSHSFCKYIIVKDSSKKEDVYKLVAIPKMYEHKEDEYLKSQGYTSYEIMHHNIKANVCVMDGKKKYVITGKTGDRYVLKNVLDRYFDYHDILTIKKIEKYLDSVKKGKYIGVEKDSIVLSTQKDDAITLDNLNSLIQRLQEIYSSDIYSYSTILTIGKNIPLILEKKIEDQVTLVFELLKLLKTNERTSADLSEIGMSKQTGILLISSTISPTMKFVSESVTGYYSKVIFEVPKNGI